MILTKTQAAAVHEGMSALRAIGARVTEILVPDGTTHIVVSMRFDGDIGICSKRSSEEHRALGAFATAYGIDETPLTSLAARRAAVDAHARTVSDSLQALRDHLAQFPAIAIGEAP